MRVSLSFVFDNDCLIEIESVNILLVQGDFLIVNHKQYELKLISAMLLSVHESER